MSMYKQFKTDDTLEKQGVVIDYGPFRVTVARAGGANKRFQLLLDAKSKPFKRAIQLETLPVETADRIMREVYAEAVVLKWETNTAPEDSPEPQWVEGIEQPDGSVAPATKENIEAAFIALPDLFADIREQAGKAALFREEVRKAEAGN